MAVFSYRALTPGGRTRGGVIAAETARAAWQELRTRGVYPTELRPQAAGHGAAARRLAAAELAAATRQLATLVEAGLPVAEALAALAEQADHPALVRALTVAQARLREGEPLADALAASPRVFPPLFRDLVRAGEASGALAAALARLADYTEATAAVRTRLRAALTYPLVMAAATVAVLAFLLAWVVPQLAQLFAETGATLPLATRVLIGFTSALRSGWPLLAAVAVVAAWTARRALATEAGRASLDAALLDVPVVGRIVRRAAVARVARTVATLLAGGVALEAALEITAAGSGNSRIASAIRKARDAVRDGEPLADALRKTGVFPPLVARLVAVGERGGTLPAMLERAATTYDREVDAAISTAIALLEPALVLVMGGVVLAIVAAVLLPLLDLGSLVQ
jgi:general secretion pathway protein F